jgi:hypothetical protein
MEVLLMRSTRSFVAVVLTALITAACSSSSSGGDGGGDQAPAQTNASTYVDGVCTALGDWQSGLDADNATMEATLSSGTPTLDDTKTALVDFLTSTVDGTKAMVSDIEALGVPDVDGGDEVASTLSAALGEVVTLFQGALDNVEGLSTDDPAGMTTALTDLATNISQGSTEIGDALSGLDTPELETAANDSEACAAISG